MNKYKKEQLLNKAKEFFKLEVVTNHINNACSKASKLSSYNINPFLASYLANFLKGNDNPRSIAEALVLPRILGTAITGSFGSKTQKMINYLFDLDGSTTTGIDIEFIDATNGRKIYCQLKSGPNTINKDDITTIVNHFDGVRNLARTNNLNIGINDMIVGVVYGKKSDLSAHYNKINKSYPVLVGKEFWYRLTGDEEFYKDLIEAIGEVALEVDGTLVLSQTIDSLAKEIKASDLFDFE